MQLTEIYSSGCKRLMRLLKAEGGSKGRLGEYIREQIQKAIIDAGKEMGIYENFP